MVNIFMCERLSKLQSIGGNKNKFPTFRKKSWSNEFSFLNPFLDHICEVNCHRTAIFCTWYILVSMSWVMLWLKPQNHCLKHHVRHRAARALCHILSAFLQNWSQWSSHHRSLAGRDGRGRRAQWVAHGSLLYSLASTNHIVHLTHLFGDLSLSFLNCKITMRK